VSGVWVCPNVGGIVSGMNVVFKSRWHALNQADWLQQVGSLRQCHGQQTAMQCPQHGQARAQSCTTLK
jgi:hypothetical protein